MHLPTGGDDEAPPPVSGDNPEYRQVAATPLPAIQNTNE